MTPIFSMSGVSVIFEGSAPFAPITCSAKAGDLILLTGPSGCGKSTFLSLLFGTRSPSAGLLSCATKSHLQPQSDMLLPWKTIEENLLFSGVESEMIPHFLSLVGLEGCMQKKPRELSVGMRQRVAFLRTLFSGKSLLLFDEPFSGLDEDRTERMIDLLKDEHRKRGFTAVVSAHSSHALSLLQKETPCRHWSFNEGQACFG